MDDSTALEQDRQKSASGLISAKRMGPNLVISGLLSDYSVSLFGASKTKENLCSSASLNISECLLKPLDIDEFGREAAQVYRPLD